MTALRHVGLPRKMSRLTRLFRETEQALEERVLMQWVLRDPNLPVPQRRAWAPAGMPGPGPRS